MRLGLSSAMNYTLNSLQMLDVSNEESGQSKLGLRFIYRVRRGSQTVTQNFTVSYDITNTEEGFTLSNMDPGETGALVIDRVPALADFVNTFVTSFHADYNDTPFNLSTVKFVASSDSNLWFVSSFTN